MSFSRIDLATSRYIAIEEEFLTRRRRLIGFISGVVIARADFVSKIDELLFFPNDSYQYVQMYCSLLLDG